MSEQLTPREEFEQHFDGWQIPDADWQWLKEFLARHTDGAVDFDARHPPVHWEWIEAFRVTLSSGEKFTYPREQVEIIIKSGEPQGVDPGIPARGDARFYQPGETNEDAIRRIVRSELVDQGIIPDTDGYIKPPKHTRGD